MAFLSSGEMMWLAAMMARDGDHVHRGAFVPELLHERVGHDDGGFRVASDVDRGTAPLRDAYDGEVEVVHLEGLAHRVFAAGEELLPYLGADDAHLAFPIHVGLVDETAELQRLRVDLLEVGGVPHQVVLAFAFVVRHLLRAAPVRGRRIADARYLSPDGFQVVHVEVPPAARRHALVGDARAVGEEVGRVGGVAAQRCAGGTAQPHPEAHHHGEHEDAPEDAQSRHDAPFAVAGDGFPDFFPAVEVEHGLPCVICCGAVRLSF